MATYTNEDIIRYVEEELSSEEKQKMEEDLRSDAVLKERVELYRQLKGTLEQRLRADETGEAVRRTLGDMREKYFAGARAIVGAGRTGDSAKTVAGGFGGTGGGGGDVVGTGGAEDFGGTGGRTVARARVVKMRPVLFRRYMVGVAAAAAVVFAVVLLWPSDYLDSYGKTQMVGVTERGGNNDTLMEKASAYFNAGQFDKALPLLDQSFAKDSTDQTALFYRGVARLHVGAVDQARQDLQAVYGGGSLFQYEAAFYMALSYARQKNKDIALQWLNKIPAGAPGADKAAGLRRKLE